MPVGALVTVPDPLTLTLSAYFLRLKCARTLVADITGTVQVIAAVQLVPLVVQPARSYSVAGAASSVTEVPAAKFALQPVPLPVQLIPAGLLVIVPDPSIATFKVKPEGDNDGAPGPGISPSAALGALAPQPDRTNSVPIMIIKGATFRVRNSQLRFQRNMSTSFP